MLGVAVVGADDRHPVRRRHRQQRHRARLAAARAGGGDHRDRQRAQHAREHVPAAREAEREPVEAVEDAREQPRAGPARREPPEPALEGVGLLPLARHQRKRARMYFVASAAERASVTAAAVADALVGLVGHLDPVLLVLVDQRVGEGLVHGLVGGPLLDLDRRADAQVLGVVELATARARAAADRRPGGAGRPARCAPNELGSPARRGTRSASAGTARAARSLSRPGRPPTGGRRRARGGSSPPGRSGRSASAARASRATARRGARPARARPCPGA